MQKYRDEIAEICHEIVEDGYRLGIVTDAEMREFETDSFSKPNHGNPPNHNNGTCNRISRLPQTPVPGSHHVRLHLSRFSLL